MTDPVTYVLAACLALSIGAAVFCAWRALRSASLLTLVGWVFASGASLWATALFFMLLVHP